MSLWKRMYFGLMVSTSLVNIPAYATRGWGSGTPKATSQFDRSCSLVEPLPRMWVSVICCSSAQTMCLRAWYRTSALTTGSLTSHFIQHLSFIRLLLHTTKWFSSLINNDWKLLVFTPSTVFTYAMRHVYTRQTVRMF